MLPLVKSSTLSLFYGLLVKLNSSTLGSIPIIGFRACLLLNTWAFVPPQLGAIENIFLNYVERKICVQ